MTCHVGGIDSMRPFLLAHTRLMRFVTSLRSSVNHRNGSSARITEYKIPRARNRSLGDPRRLSLSEKGDARIGITDSSTRASTSTRSYTRICAACTIITNAGRISKYRSSGNGRCTFNPAEASSIFNTTHFRCHPQGHFDKRGFRSVAP